MVTIINYKARESEAGAFYVLELQSGVEMVKSQTTNQYYATAKKAYISSTFDEQTCQALIGTQMQGNINKVACDPYEYTIKKTGETIILSHRYEYVDEATTTNEDIAIKKLLSDAPVVEELVM